MKRVALCIALAACSKDPPCVTPAGELPDGDLNDPYAMHLPDDCVPGGMGDALGRWFVVNPTQLFSFSYPKIQGQCGNGFRRSDAPAEDHDASDGATFYTWSDGTLYFERSEAPNNGDQLVEATAYCVRQNGELGVAQAASYRGMTGTAKLTGTRFVRDEPVADGLEYVGSVSAEPSGEPIQGLDLAIDGGYAYVVGLTGLDIIDVHQPAAPHLVSHLDGSLNDITIVHGDGRTIAYVSPFDTQITESTEYIDVTDPAAPVVAGSLGLYSHTMFRVDRDAHVYLYLASYTDNVPVFDVTHPLAPVSVAGTRVPFGGGGVHDMTVDGNTIFANDTTSGFVAFDATHPRTPKLLGHLATSYSHTSLVATLGGKKVAFHGDEGSTGTPDGMAFLRVLDADPASPTFFTELGRFQSRPDVGIHNLQLVGERLYVSYYQQGVRVLDVSDPAHPVEIAHYNTWDPLTAPGEGFEGAVGIAVAGRLVFVADDLAGLIILRDPALAY